MVSKNQVYKDRFEKEDCKRNLAKADYSGRDILVLMSNFVKDSVKFEMT
jgi:hypothetical protein